MNKAGEYALRACAVGGWLALIAWVFAFTSGGAKRAMDYAHATVRSPLRDGDVLSATDQQHAFWSGWIVEERKGLRRSVGINPDVVFRRDGESSTCSAKIVLSSQPTGRPQRVYVSLNRSTPKLLDVAADGSYDVPAIGDSLKGLNTISFHLPDTILVGDRLVSIALRSITVSCDEADVT